MSALPSKQTLNGCASRNPEPPHQRCEKVVCNDGRHRDFPRDPNGPETRWTEPKPSMEDRDWWRANSNEAYQEGRECAQDEYLLIALDWLAITEAELDRERGAVSVARRQAEDQEKSKLAALRRLDATLEQIAALEDRLAVVEQERDDLAAVLNEPLRSDHPALVAAEKRGHERGWDAAREEFGGMHYECRHFVLDPQHDPVAREALSFYAGRTPNTDLRRDLRDRLDSLATTTSAADVELPAVNGAAGIGYECPDCGWQQKPHPTYGWQRYHDRAVDVHKAHLCPGRERPATSAADDSSGSGEQVGLGEEAKELERLRANASGKKPLFDRVQEKRDENKLSELAGVSRVTAYRLIGKGES